jgi:hypothetical protein
MFHERPPLAFTHPGFKQDYIPSPTRLTLTGIVIIILLYANDIVLMMRSPYDLDKKLRVLKDFFSSMGMNVNPKRSLMILSYMTLTTWRKFLHTNISKLIFTTSSTRTIAMRK